MRESEGRGPTPEVFDRRQQRLWSAARAAGLEALVLYTSGGHSFLEMDTVWYASGVRTLGEAAVVLQPAAPPRMLASPEWDVGRIREEAAIADVLPTRDPLAALAAWRRDRGLRGPEIGFSGTDKLMAARAAAVDEALGDGWREADALVLRAAARRDELEIMLAERATLIAEEGFRQALETARPGMREYELAAELDASMRELGAEDNFLLISASQHNLAVHAPGERVLERGDVILAEISPSCGGQFTQICRTAVLGPVPAALREGYALLDAAARAGVEACRVGAAVSEVAAAVDGVISAAGYSDYCRPPYMRTRGHGMGLGSVLPGDLRAGGDVRLEPGMLFVLHPNQYLPQTGYLLCGEPVVIDEQRAHVLTARAGQIEEV
jgi:Xaa-Pro dipeptidase